jgi:dolichol-phosphate mannosyltransferase
MHLSFILPGRMVMMKLLVVVPTYNESLNIELFLGTVFNNLPQDAEVLVVDDNSPDGTAKLVESKILEYAGRLHLLNRPEKQGLAQAYLAAFDWGLSGAYDTFLEIDADFSHNPKYITEMISAIQIYDVVIGSRNIKGGGVEGWSAVRNLVSKGGSFYSRIVLGCPIKDLTGGFNMWRKTALERIGLRGIISKGYSFQVEMKYRAYAAGCSVKEIPIIFPDRKLGKSKMSKGIFLEALINIWKIKKSVNIDNRFNQFVKFATVGILGSITNLVIFFICADNLLLPEIPVSIACFLIAVTQNYFINHKWSFKRETAAIPVSFLMWLKFTVSSLLGLAVNVLVLKIVLSFFAVPYKFIAQGCGIAAGMIFNFLVSKFIVFRRAQQ